MKIYNRRAEGLTITAEQWAGLLCVGRQAGWRTSGGRATLSFEAPSGDASRAEPESGAGLQIATEECRGLAAALRGAPPARLAALAGLPEAQLERVLSFLDEGGILVCHDLLALDAILRDQTAG